MYIALDDNVSNSNPFNNIGFTEDQIGLISESEKIIALLIEQYLTNLRLKCFATQIEANEYMEIKHAVKVLGTFFDFVHDIPLSKQQFDRNIILKNAEEEAEKLARDGRGE